MQSISGRLLAALAHPRSPHDFLELVKPLHSAHEVRARVESVVCETHDVATLLLRTNARWRGHRAGQHVLLTAEIGGVRRTRCFSVASAEGDDVVALTVKAKPGGRVTPAIVSGALAGKIVSLSQASGEFTLPNPVPQRILLLSGGSGITPVMSMLRTLRARRWDGEISFVHYARSNDDVIYAAELQRLRAEVRIGHFRAAHLQERDVDTWACGPPPFLDAVRAVISPERLRVERYTLGATTGSSEGEITFARSGKTAKGRGPLLAIAERAGLSPESGCRMGICKTCVCRKVSGVTRDLRTGAISAEADVDVQLCVNEPVGPVEIDL